MDDLAPAAAATSSTARDVTPADLVAGEVPAQEAARPLSVFDLMRVGIGPSSSHTVGPMRAGRAFAAVLAQAVRHSEAPAPLAGGPASPDSAASPANPAPPAVPESSAEVSPTPLVPPTAPASPTASATPPTPTLSGTCCGPVARISIELFGSLGATGRGHATDRAVVMGLAGYAPETVPTDVCTTLLEQTANTGQLQVDGVGPVPFTASDIRFLPGRVLPYHVNALTLTAYRGDGTQLARRTYYSVGGGFVMEDTGSPSQPAVHALATAAATRAHAQAAPYPFTSGATLLDLCARTGMRVSDLVRANECSARPETEVDAYLDLLHRTMRECIDAGLATDGVLPGGLGVRRRAKALHERLLSRATGPDAAFAQADPLRGMDWVDLFALAVNEENAAGRRVVTAPTNGAAGVLPAVLAYYERFIPGADRAGVHRFLLAATAVGGLIKTNASIAGAEVGCQGEVGSASSMAAAGLAEALGGTPAQVENAAEIAMEHNLGLTCDPVGGLVQIPCIERNAVAAVKAINAARMALWGEGRHAVSLDAVIETMRQTGQDMLSKYKETATGGLAVNVVEC
ncbi:L-serine ammonia-lyase [Actinomyces bovis]|nr:L-serine ammonia-lyase [Actinomyces bovis]